MVTVDPDQLDSYAEQLARNAYALEDTTGYITDSCNNVEGMTGILAIVGVAAMFNAGLSVDLVRTAGRNLYKLSSTLCDAAEDYRTKDTESAERILKSYDESWEELPEGYAETDTNAHPGDYSDIAAVSLPKPGQSNGFKPKVEAAKENLDIIESSIKEVFGFSLAENVLAPAFGNWDSLPENAEGYKNLAAPEGILAIRDNIMHGMDSLSASWDSEGSTAFDFVIRQRWSGFLEFLSHNFAFQSATWETTAQEALTVFDLLVFAIGEGATHIPEAVKRFKMTLIVSGGVGQKDIDGLVALYLDFISTLKQILELLIEICKLWLERIKTAETQLQLLNDVLAGKIHIPG